MGKDIGSSGVYQTSEGYGHQQYMALQDAESKKLRRETVKSRLYEWGKWERDGNVKPRDKACGAIQENTLHRQARDSGARSIQITAEGQDRLYRLEVPQEYYDEQERLCSEMNGRIRELDPLTVAVLEMVFVERLEYKDIEEKTGLNTKKIQRVIAEAKDRLE